MQYPLVQGIVPVSSCRLNYEIHRRGLSLHPGGIDLIWEAEQEAASSGISKELEFL